MIRYVKLDRKLVELFGGDHAAAYVLAVIEVATRYGGWSKTQKELADVCCVSLAKVERVLKMLRERGFIKSKKSAIVSLKMRVENPQNEGVNPSNRGGEPLKMRDDTLLNNNNQSLNNVDEGAFGEAEQFGIVFENFVKHYEAVTNSPYIPNFASNQNFCRELASQFFQLAKVMVARETGEDRSPTPDEFTAVVQQWLSKGYEAADRWQRDRWSIELISKQFPIITKKINENEL